MRDSTFIPSSNPLQRDRHHAFGLISPIGSTAEEAAARRAARSPVYRAERERWQESEQLAWKLIRYRMDRRLTQRQLANRIGVSHPTVARRRDASPTTRARIAAALTVD